MKIVCQVCENKGYLQHIGKNYYRVRHYLGSVDGKLRFSYHKQSFGCVQNMLKKNEAVSIDPIGQNSIDLKLSNNGSVIENQGAGSLARLESPILAIFPAQPLFFFDLAGMNAELATSLYFRKCGEKLSSNRTKRPAK
jgi:hypothetical protein